MQIPTSLEPLRPVAGRSPADPAQLAVCARGLGKDYVHDWTRKVTQGLDGLDLDVRRGEVLGILGPNGAGKTTTLKILTGLLKPTRGQAWLMGEPVERTASRRSLGFLPEQPYFYDYLNGLEYLELAGRLSGLDRTTARARAAHWLERVGLGDRPKLRLRKYSKGMLQRLGLAAALVHEPELLILDEPMSGLDPFGRRDVRELILEQRARGVTVLFSSHILPDVEMLCDRVAIILGGRLARVAPLDALVADAGGVVEIRCAAGHGFELPEGCGSIERMERAGETVLRLADGAGVQRVLAALLRADVPVRAVTPQRHGLEALFLREADAADAHSTDGAARRSA